MGFPCDVATIDAMPPSSDTPTSCPSGAVCYGYMGAMTCASRACDRASSTCRAPLCDDEVKNGWETGTDCGGACAPCRGAPACHGPYDCASAICAFDDGVESLNSAAAVSTHPGGGGRCGPNSTADGVQNGNEADVDCGAAMCTAFEKRKDCPQICVAGMLCQTGEDCRSSVCNPTDQEPARTR